MRKQLLFLTAVAFVLGFAPAPFPRPGRRIDDTRGLEGTWMRPAGGSQIIIKRGQMIYNPGPRPYVYLLKLDLARKPAAYDITGAPGGPVAGRAFLGICKMEGDTLTLCYNAASKGRPANFVGPGQGMFTEVYKRASR